MNTKSLALLVEVIQQNILDLKCARQSGPVSSYLFILRLEIVFILMKANKRVKGSNIFKHTYLYLAYADKTTFSLREKRSVKEFNILIYLLHFQSICV